MKLARISFLALVVCVAGVAVLHGSTVSGSLTAPQAAAPHPPLSGGASSVDDLLAKFVAAIEAKDVAALDALRVDETEYRKIIMPGSRDARRLFRVSRKLLIIALHSLIL